MIIRLYIGAHKTATTHIQQTLKLNQGYLLNQDVKVSLPIDLRSAWLPSLYQCVRSNHESEIDILKSLSPEKGIWIIAEENISGVSKEYLTAVEMYPNLKERLTVLMNVFNEAKIELFFSIRSYETYYRSAYLEVVRNNAYIPFSEFYNEKRYGNYSWLSVLDTFCEFMPEKDIHVWCYEDLEKIMPRVLKNMVTADGSEGDLKELNTGKTRPSISKRTLDILADSRDKLNGEDSRSLVELLNKIYPAGNNNPKYMPFNEADIGKFQKQYKEEVKSIPDKYPKLNFYKQ